MTRPTILIADDSEPAVELLRACLRPIDCEILVAADGDQALEMAQKQLPDLILLDVLLPKSSGWEVCQTLKAVRRTSHLKVVLVTARGEVKDRLTGLQVGADDYLVKPFDRADVLKRARTLLAKPVDGPPDIPERRTALPAGMFDPATGLPTTAMVLGRLKEWLIEQGELGIVFIDIEQFEAIEAEYGWAFFDEFLRRAAELASAEAGRRFVHPIVATSVVAGSSFYIYFETKGSDLGAEGAFDALAGDLRLHLVQAMRERFPKMGAEQTGFFVGMARIEYRPQIRLERQIYQGMQTAAEAVRGAEQQRKKQLTRELRDIIRRKRITTLFQPIVHARSSKVFGYEILTRGPESSSFRNSDMLFSFARENRLAWSLEALALESSLRRLRSVDLLDRKFLINLEAEMFGESEFRIHEMVSFFAEHPGHFVFELTERAAIEDYGVFRSRLDEFRAKGIEVAIDDAGSGYASLEAIAAIAPDYLKITKGLVSTLAREPIKQDLVKMLVELARRINARIIAEGVETHEEYITCRDLGIDLLQGYYLAYPQEDLRLADEDVGKTAAAAEGVAPGLEFAHFDRATSSTAARNPLPPGEGGAKRG
ncbi:MAG TPA: EAL domain-containing protein [Thermoanaerobaculia bacterium]|nr:EAL domain-containing protein [Thermoanaerobaculia bacterium]